MQILINDTPIVCGEKTTLTQLLAQEGIQPTNIAIAMDNVVIPKVQWDTTCPKENSNIIIIKAVQGG